MAGAAEVAPAAVVAAAALSAVVSSDELSSLPHAASRAREATPSTSRPRNFPVLWLGGLWLGGFRVPIMTIDFMNICRGGQARRTALRG